MALDTPETLPAPRGIRTLSGTMVGATGEPLWAALHIFVPGGSYLATATLDSGAFSYSGLDDGATYNLYAEGVAPGAYPAQWIGDPAPTPGSQVNAHPFVMTTDLVVAIGIVSPDHFDVIEPPPITPSHGSRLRASRELILDALTAAGINHATTGRWSAPCVLVEPGDPWAGVDLSLGSKRVGRWKLSLVAGRADSAGVFDELAQLVDRVDAALLTLPGVQLPTWARPFDTQVDGAAYAATSSTVQLMTPTPQEVLP